MPRKRKASAARITNLQVARDTLSGKRRKCTLIDSDFSEEKTSDNEIVWFNPLRSLDSIPLQMMRKFSTRSRRFMDAYDRGLNGKQAAWAARKYRGHRVLPPNIFEELGKEGIV